MAGGEKWRKRRAAKQAAAAARPQPRPRNMLISMLAPELQLAVLSHLPVKQIQKCRAVNRYLRDLIDSPENQTICAQPGLAQAQRRFTKFMETHVNYDVDAVDEFGVPCGFLDALTAYTKLRGIAEDYCYESVIFSHIFSDHWLLQCHKKGETQKPGHTSSDIAATRNVIDSIYGLHLHYKGVKKLSEARVAQKQATLGEGESLAIMRVPIKQLGPAILQKVLDGKLDDVPHHRQGDYVDCIAYESPYEFKLEGKLRKLGRQETRCHMVWGGEPLENETFPERLARIDAAHALAEQEEEATWSKIPEKRALRGSHLSELETRRPDKRFSLAEERPRVYDWEFDDYDLNEAGEIHEIDEVGPKLRTKLGLPELPASLPFGYYARTARTAIMVKDMLESDRKLSMLERAAMLNRIFIF